MLYFFIIYFAINLILTLSIFVEKYLCHEKPHDKFAVYTFCVFFGLPTAVVAVVDILFFDDDLFD